MAIAYGRGDSSGPVASSPYRVLVGPTTLPSAIRAWGRGLQGKGVRVKDFVDFRVNVAKAGPGLLTVRVTDPRKWRYANTKLEVFYWHNRTRFRPPSECDTRDVRSRLGH